MGHKKWINVKKFVTPRAIKMFERNKKKLWRLLQTWFYQKSNYINFCPYLVSRWWDLLTKKFSYKNTVSFTVINLIRLRSSQRLLVCFSVCARFNSRERSSFSHFSFASNEKKIQTDIHDIHIIHKCDI